MVANELPGNPHGDLRPREFGGDYANALGIARATMALAYEQRTANLIALSRAPQVSAPVSEELLRRAMDRMGVDER